MPGDSAAVGLITRPGPIDIVLEPRGFEAGYTGLIAKSTNVRRGDIEIPVGALPTCSAPKNCYGRAKDIEHLAALYQQFPQLADGREQPPPAPEQHLAFRILHRYSS